MEQVYFHQDCEVCGRPMLVRIELLGKRIQCDYCRAECEARCAESPQTPLARLIFESSVDTADGARAEGHHSGRGQHGGLD